jgi:hypothetical protein
MFFSMLQGAQWVKSRTFPALRGTPSGGDIHVVVFLSEFLSTGKMDPLTAQQPVKSV